MRVGEAIRLDREDLNDEFALLTVRGTKFGKSRQLPLHPTTTTGLRTTWIYATGTTRSAHTCAVAVHPRLPAELRTALGDLPPAGRSRRAGVPVTAVHTDDHDLRHTFAVTTLLDWYRDGADVPARLPRLSTYLGHVDPANTYWYFFDSRVIPIPAPLRV